MLNLPLGRITDKYVRESFRKLLAYLDTGATPTDGTVADTSREPAGVVKMYAGATAPAGWLVCDGRSLVRADYPDLYTAIGIVWGAADIAHFNIPDMRGQVAGGVSASHPLADAKGAETVTLDLTMIPGHDHGGAQSANAAHSHGGATTVENRSHTHDQRVGSSSGVGQPFHTSRDQLATFPNVYDQTGNASQTHTHVINSDNAAHAHSINSAGGGLAHNNLQPTKFLHYIIKV